MSPVYTRGPGGNPQKNTFRVGGRVKSVDISLQGTDVNDENTRGDRREQKRRKRRRMRVVGRSVRLLQEIIRRRSEKLRGKGR